MKKPKLRFASASLFALLLSSAALFHVATISTAQHATPVVNGSIGLGEYGTLNSQSNGGTTWYVTWDETNLYVGTSGANTTEGAVLYIDADSPLPAGAGTNAGGNATGQTYDSTNFSSLPFRADFVTYYKDSYREFRTADGAGGWSAAATGFGAYASDGSAVRELSIPWSAVTGAGRPDSFSFFAYATSPGGFVYGEVPPENPDGFIGTSATATRFYYVASTADGASTKPFTLNFTQSATHVVNTTADTNDADTADGLCLDSSALCSLRAAIQQANANPSVDAINFLIVGVGTQTINVGSTSLGALPAVVYPLTIDGYTQPGSSQNTLAVGDNAVINVELNGTSAGAGADGLNISAGGSTVRGLSIYRFNGDGIDLNTAGGNTVAGNFIGTNATGAGTTNGNAGDGVNVAGVASNTVGGSTPAARNVIAANAGEGIDITGTGATGNTVAGNYIGTDRNGAADAGNAGNGVFLSAPSNTLGGPTAAPGQGAGNVISGNTLAGVRVTTNGNGNTIAGNLIGLQSNGAAALRNDLEGVFITNAASSNTIGGATATLRNVISGHNATTNSDGVEINGAGTNSNVVTGNYIGTNAAGTVAVPNSDGVRIAAGAQSNTVGGSTATPGTAPGNVISGNTSDGVELTGASTSNNTVAGNLLGLAAGGATALGNITTGVNVTGNASSNTVGGASSNLRNVISSNSDGVVVNGASGNTVAGNYIGTDVTGAIDRGNLINGVFVAAGAQSNSIGGLTSTPGTAPGNVISGNASDGVEITGTTSSSNTVRGNLVGLAAGGTALIRNDSNGVFISNAASNTVGGTTATARNVITGGTASTSDGVDIQSEGSDNNVVAGNYVGTDINGAGANGGAGDFGAGGDGVRISGGPDGNTVGGSSPGAGNVVAGNGSDGVEVAGTGSSNNTVQGNFIGTQANGATAYGNGANGVLISAASASPVNTVGGSTATPGTGAGNVISGNTTNGVQVSTNADGTLVRGNLIGLAAGGASALGNGTNGVHLTGTINSTVGGATSDLRNVISGNGSNGVLLNEGQNATGDNNTVAGNFIGTDITGAVDLGNTGDGVHVNGGDVSTIGGLAATPGAPPGNVISGNNSDGVDLTETSGDTNNITVVGNFIGLKASGTEALANTGDGVGIRAGVTVSAVGGMTATARNVIGGNGSDGVEMASGGHTVQGNYIGTQSDGATALGNAAHGVHVSAANTTADTVGGTTAGTGNTIAFNGGDGVFVPTGFATVRRNSIHTNAGLGIDLGADGVTPNDAGDGDTGGNNLQNFPFITTAVQGSTVVTGTLNSTPSTTFTVEFFSSPAADPTGNGEGQTFLDSTTVTTDALGNAAFTYTVAATVAAGQYVSATATDPTGRTSEFSNARNVIIATLARLVEFTAVEQDGVTRLDWTTGYEVDNLGFNLYREAGGRRARLNPSLIAGSALVAGPGVALTAGNSYAWADAGAEPGAAYWLEEIDLAGRSKTYGPFHPSRGAGVASPGDAARGARSPLISQLSDGGADGGDVQRQVTSSDATRARKLTRASGVDAGEAAREKQRWLASQAALKISVRAGGWYKVTRDELIAAGLSPAADPARLQLYAGGVEVPMMVDAATWLLPEGGVEFYGEGLDVPSTDTRVYWLVEGSTRGLRMAPRRASSSGGKGTSGPAAAEAVTVVPVGAPSSPHFKYTAERRERTVYFSSLQNGEAENFFGRVVNTGTAAQTLAARNVYPLDAQTATLEVSAQGVSLGQHHVSVTLNGVTLGALDFAGQTKSAAVFPVDSQLLREGDNQVQLVSGAPGDVSLTDYLRLNYLHSMRADGDGLRFGAPSGVVSVGGFTTPDVRVFDVTDPYAPEELPTAGAVTPDPRGGWGVRVGVAGAGTRELLALTGARVSRPAVVAPNEPSRWSVDAGQRADMVVITHGDFAEQVAPLAAARASEGMEVRVVNVEDIFDEFAYGAHTPQAVRDFIAWTRANWAKAPAYVLLVGDGSYDPRDYLGRGRFDLVPSKLLDAGAMETASDDWFADFDDDGVADIAVGRLPVRTRAEAAVVVGKILSRTADESEPTALLVADRDGADGYSFESATNALLSLLPEDVEVARVNRRGQDAGVLRGQIVAGVNAGPLVVNWMGHGSIDVWTGEGLLRGADAPALTNGSRLPLFVMMTCLNGYYEGTGLDSLAESMLKAEGGGAYAVWASTGMTEPGAQAAANRELYRIIFSEDGVRLGDAVRRAKHATADRDVRRTWVFFGDPSSRLR